jgi:creatinine amidohydrolase
VVVPLGSTEQHAYLSLSTDAILAERIGADAAEPLGVPVYPAIPFGLAPYFMAFPGTITLSPGTYSHLLHDVLDSLAESGFRRIFLVNGHGGNAPAEDVAREWAKSRPGVKVRFHSWWKAPRTRAKATLIDPLATHGSWMENFPWTRLADVVMPGNQKPASDLSDRDTLSAAAVRDRLGDGSMGGYYERSDHEMMDFWAVAVQECRELIRDPWEDPAAEQEKAGPTGGTSLRL